MKLYIFKTNEKYDMLSGWWRAWKWTPPSEDFLPETGFMVEVEGVDICAGFIYVAGNVSWIEFIISNPEYRGRDKRTAAIDLLVASLVHISERSGSKYCFSMLKSRSLMNVFELNGFTKGDSNSTEMILKL